MSSIPWASPIRLRLPPYRKRPF
jgi:hypothetical protein